MTDCLLTIFLDDDISKKWVSSHLSHVSEEFGDKSQNNRYLYLSICMQREKYKRGTVHIKVFEASNYILIHVGWISILRETFLPFVLP